MASARLPGAEAFRLSFAQNQRDRRRVAGGGGRPARHGKLQPRREMTEALFSVIHWHQIQKGVAGLDCAIFHLACGVWRGRIRQNTAAQTGQSDDGIWRSVSAVLVILHCSDVLLQFV